MYLDHTDMSQYGILLVAAGLLLGGLGIAELIKMIYDGINAKQDKDKQNDPGGGASSS